MHLPLRRGAQGLRGKRYPPPGTPPGTLQHVAAGAPALRCRLMEFDHGEYRQRDVEEDALPVIRPPHVGFMWLDIGGIPSGAQLTALGQAFNIHRLALEDVVNQGQRPKLDDYEDRLFAVLARPLWRNGQVHLEQANLILGENFVISIRSSVDDPFAPVRLHLKERTRRFVDGSAAYLLHALIDLTVDEYFPVLDALGEDIEETELELLDHADRNTLAHIHILKRELLLLRRQLWPMRETINQLLRYEGPLLEPTLKPYLKDVYDHGMYLIDLVESYRDMTSGMLDVYLSSVSYRLNDVMRVLTIIATIFIPLTFITGIYGMNFGSNTTSPWAMPELRWYYGYPLALLLIVAVAVGMLIFFKRKHWL
jgi:magnesium transporter